MYMNQKTFEQSNLETNTLFQTIRHCIDPKSYERQNNYNKTSNQSLFANEYHLI
jgi:hypothetical protein